MDIQCVRGTQKALPLHTGRVALSSPGSQTSLERGWPVPDALPLSPVGVRLCSGQEDSELSEWSVQRYFFRSTQSLQVTFRACKKITLR